MSSALAVALGGACGALARYGAGRLVARVVEQTAPWGTWVVNLVGCFLIGMAVPLLGQLNATRELRFFLVVGFLGSFTTFSTYRLDTLVLWDGGHSVLALLNAVGSLAGGLVLVAVGRAVAAWLMGS
jgi:CrcB protein